MDDGAFVAETSGGEAEVASEVWEVLAADVAQRDPLEGVPAARVRGAVRSVPGELLAADASGAALGQDVLDRLATLDGSAVPDDQERAGDVAQQQLEEAPAIRARVGMILHQHAEPAGRCDAADDRQMLAAQWQAEDGRLTTRRGGADGAGEQGDARFIAPDDGPTLLVSPFLRAGQRAVRQAASAASFRGLARSIGVWTLQPSARGSLPT